MWFELHIAQNLNSFRFEISLSENWHNWGNSNIEHFGNAFSGILVCVCQFYGTLHLWSILANLSSNFSSREIRVTVNTFVCPWLPSFIGPDYELVQILFLWYMVLELDLLYQLYSQLIPKQRKYNLKSLYLGLRRTVSIQDYRIVFSI